MSSLLSSLVAALLLINLVALGSTRIATVVRAVGFQGALLALLAVASHRHPGPGFGYRIDPEYVAGMRLVQI